MRRADVIRWLICGSIAGLWSVLCGCGAETLLVAGLPPDKSATKEAVPATDLKPNAAAPLITVAVTRFEDQGTSVEFNRLGAAIAEMLAHDLGEFPSLRILERTASGVLIQERVLGETKIVGDNNGGADKLTAEYLITGTSTASAGKLVVTATLTKVGVDKPQATWQHSGAVEDFIGFEAALVKEVTKSLGVKSGPGREVVPAAADKRPTLAILSLTNHSPAARLDIMQTGFAEILQSSVGAIKGVQLVERTEIERVLAEQKLSLAGLVDPKTAVQVGQLLKADRLLVGSFLEIGTNLSIQVRMIDTSSGSIVASERVSGPRENFSLLLEDLTLRTASDLFQQPAGDNNKLVHAALPARSLEAAIHLTTAGRLLSEGRNPQAVEAFQQVLLLEPGNISCYMRQMSVLWLQASFKELARTGNQALGREEFATAPAAQRAEILWLLAHGYSELNRYPQLVQVTDRIVAEFPNAKHRANSLRGGTLLRLNRREEGVQLLESAAAGIPDPANDWKDLGLRELFLFHAFHSNGSRATASARTTEKTKESCRRAMEIFDRILISAAGKRDRAAKFWAGILIPNLADQLTYYEGRGRSRPYLSPAEKVDAMQRALEVFGWDPVSRAEANFSIGRNAETAELWAPAVQAHREFLQTCPLLEGQPGRHQGFVPSSFDFQVLQPNTWIDQKIEAYYRLAKITQDGLKQPALAAQAYQDMVREVGLTNFRGPDAVAGMAKLGITPKYPDQCALVWGWDSNGQRSWERALSPSGYKVHSLRTTVVTPAQLAPYSLIILARPGTIIYTPTEMLALRSYVASGGSLLAIVSPGWEPAAPTIHNGLLKFFDIEAGAPLAARTTATHIVPHPITKGVTAAMAKSAVALRGPTSSILISEGNNGLLAATEYRFGRVVVAAFGQWFLPEPAIFPGGWMNYHTGHWTTQSPPADLPLEEGDGLCRVLRDNVIRWLGERPSRSPEFAKWKEALEDAHWTARRVQARDLEWKEMAAPHQKLIASAPDALAREESLWTAGDAYFQLRCFSENRHLSLPAYSLKTGSIDDPEPRHYEQLLEQYPDSPLLQYAHWRLAECERLKVMFRAGGNFYWDRASTLPVIAAFGKVSADRGTHPWAWARIMQGAMAIRMNDLPAAIVPLKDVVDAMPRGPERTLALAMVGDCLIKAMEPAEARRIYEELKSLPLMSWNKTGDWLTEWFVTTQSRDSSGQIAYDGLQKLGKQ